MTNVFARWPAPPNVFALSTTRRSGFSESAYESNNLGLHVGDLEAHVLANRQVLQHDLGRPLELEWLDQTHSTLCVLVEEETNRVADAAITRSAERTLAIMTADCLPIMLSNKQGNEIAAIHAGWRGLVNGIVENTLAKMHSQPEQLLAWIGPAICHSCFEVGGEVLDAYREKYSFASKAFSPRGEKWMANLPQLAELVLRSLGVHSVIQSNLCTFERSNDFYSYRRTAQTGRMATLIWFNDNKPDN